VSDHIFHITSRTIWAAAQVQGFYTTGDGLEKDRFIHCSKFDQVLRVANNFFRGQRGLVLLAIDPARLTSELRWEPGVDTNTELFPHIYGPINLDAVVEVLDFEPGADGTFTRLPPLITIRPARPEDASLAAELIHLSMGSDADWFFGQERGHLTDEVISALYLRPGNRFGYNLVKIAEIDGQPAGLLLAYPASASFRLNLTTGWHLLGIFGLGGVVRMIRRISRYGLLTEARGGEFYVSNIAVVPTFQGRGIGSRLLVHADEMARVAHLRKGSLVVAMENETARRLYERHGYRIVASTHFRRPAVIGGSAGVHRMVKDIDPSAP
jgi:uncharacterized protein (DUF952 family)/ribosomal protein S18 acetylase RimI-like enzyme